MEIVVLTFEGCPNAEPAIQLVRQNLRELGLDSEVVVRKILCHPAKLGRSRPGFDPVSPN
jgi:hypothetical protein